MKQVSLPRLVLMDYDDTFVSTNPVYKRCWTVLFSQYGQFLSDTLWNRLMNDNVLPGDYLTKDLGVKVSRKAIAQIERDVREVMKEQGTVPGAERFIVNMRSAGARIALWTNSPKQWVDETAPDGSLELFDFFVYEAAKPSPTSVMRASAEARCAPNDVLGIDNASPGVRALKATGARVIHFQAPDEPPLGMKDVYSIDDLSKADLTLVVSEQNRANQISTVSL